MVGTVKKKNGEIPKECNRLRDRASKRERQIQRGSESDRHSDSERWAERRTEIVKDGQRQTKTEIPKECGRKAE